MRDLFENHCDWSMEDMELNLPDLAAPRRR